MELEQITTEILKIYPQWQNISCTIAGDKNAELEESFVRDLIIMYCENKGNEVNGYPFQNKSWVKQTTIMTKIIFVTNAI